METFCTSFGPQAPGTYGKLQALMCVCAVNSSLWRWEVEGRLSPASNSLYKPHPPPPVKPKLGEVTQNKARGGGRTCTTPHTPHPNTERLTSRQDGEKEIVILRVARRQQYYAKKRKHKQKGNRSTSRFAPLDHSHLRLSDKQAFWNEQPPITMYYLR
ncbi:unnamed protein product, partial [Ectocarpus sp. 13 AM-2016]